jgi:hypothetical protein
LELGLAHSCENAESMASPFAPRQTNMMQESDQGQSGSRAGCRVRSPNSKFSCSPLRICPAENETQKFAFISRPSPHHLTPSPAPLPRNTSSRLRPPSPHPMRRRETRLERAHNKRWWVARFAYSPLISGPGKFSITPR